MRKAFFFMLISFLFVELCVAARAQEIPPADKERVERLFNVCKVWGTIRYLHPHLAYQDIDWDAALLKALPKIMAAKNTEDYAAAVQTMLDALADPATRVVRMSAEKQRLPRADVKRGEKKLCTWIEKDTLLIDVHDPGMLSPLVRDPRAAAELRREIGRARRVIIDYRANFPRLAWSIEQLRIYDLLSSREIPAIGRRYVVHSGYRAQTGPVYGGYHSALQTEFGESFQAVADGKPRKSVFLLQADAKAPRSALALQRAGDSFVLVQGKASQELVVPQRELRLADGYNVRVRMAELVTPEGGAYSFQADAEVPADEDVGLNGPALKAALALLKDPKPRKRNDKAKAVQPLPQPVWRPDKRYADKAYPDLEHRLLAAFRFWSVIHFFYPYRHLMDRDWDAVLTDFIPKFIAARNAREYALTVAEMSTHVPDGHTRVASQELQRFFGNATVPIRLRWIEGAPVVTELAEETVCKDAGIRIGDVVLTVGGPVPRRAGAPTSAPRRPSAGERWAARRAAGRNRRAAARRGEHRSATWDFLQACWADREFPADRDTLSYRARREPTRRFRIAGPVGGPRGLVHSTPPRDARQCKASGRSASALSLWRVGGRRGRITPVRGEPVAVLRRGRKSGGGTCASDTVSWRANVATSRGTSPRWSRGWSRPSASGSRWSPSPSAT
jgi:hypothetical protein